MDTVFINGGFVRRDEASVGVTDMGFNYGAGVYEVINVYEGVPYRLAEHLERFERSAHEIGLSLDMPDLPGVCTELIRRNGSRNAVIYLQATLGDYGLRSHTFPPVLVPTIVAFTQAAPVYPERCFTEGVSLQGVADLRWSRCDIKSISLIANLLAVNEALKAGCDEALFVSPRDNTVAECGASNIFAVEGGRLITPPKGTRVLSGITREAIIRVARGTLEVKEEYLELERLKKADEVFISSTTKEIIPVNQIDGAPIKAPGPVTLRLMQALISDVERETGKRHPKQDLLGRIAKNA